MYYKKLGLRISVLTLFVLHNRKKKSQDSPQRSTNSQDSPTLLTTFPLRPMYTHPLDGARSTLYITAQWSSVYMILFHPSFNVQTQLRSTTLLSQTVLTTTNAELTKKINIPRSHHINNNMKEKASVSSPKPKCLSTRIYSNNSRNLKTQPNNSIKKKKKNLSNNQENRKKIKETEKMQTIAIGIPTASK